MIREDPPYDGGPVARYSKCRVCHLISHCTRKREKDIVEVIVDGMVAIPAHSTAGSWAGIEVPLDPQGHDISHSSLARRDLS